MKYKPTLANAYEKYINAMAGFVLMKRSTEVIKYRNVTTRMSHADIINPISF